MKGEGLSYLSLFKMPTLMKITGRSSSITNAFINSIIPVIKPSEEDIKEALNVLDMDKENFLCAYCGDGVTEWDHLRPLVINQKPTGFISEIQNLIPSCGKCNQSKGNKDWHQWIVSDAPKSPKTRGIEDIHLRIYRLNEYENWRKPTTVNFESIVGEERWQQHWINWKTVLKTMESSQVLAAEIAELVAQKYSPTTDISTFSQSVESCELTLKGSVSCEKDEIEKVSKKLNRWVRRPNQICCKILNKYLQLANNSKSITKDQLKSELPELVTFDANFAQMKTISERNHAKIFEMNGDFIEVWSPVKNLVANYHAEVRQKWD